MKTKKQRKPTGYVVSLLPEDLPLIAAGLNELPRKFSEPLLQRLQAQVSAQDAADAASKTPPPTSASRAKSG